ncbi:hypothetical protein [Bacillus cabrialesii]|uniref:hypothetical protein n=1 Tax=Bacillus cabrialesii TaxID=2487276 RepID=UPI0028FB691E|nr:hypothetical protein [Bacillus cabrialesii]MDU0153993.1 hypothetical protein [Bacillus cabrialesii]
MDENQRTHLQYINSLVGQIKTGLEKVRAEGKRPPDEIVIRADIMEMLESDFGYQFTRVRNPKKAFGIPIAEDKITEPFMFCWIDTWLPDNAIDNQEKRTRIYESSTSLMLIDEYIRSRKQNE